MPSHIATAAADASARGRLAAIAILAAVLALQGCDTRVGAPDPAAPDLRLETIELTARNPDRLRLALIGDMHGDLKIASGLLARHRAEPYDAVLILGDNFGKCGVTGSEDPEWQLLDQLQPLGVPLLPVLGNHDYGNPMERRGKLRYCGDPDPGSQIRGGDASSGWTFPSRSYIVRSELATMLMIDTTPVHESFGFSFRGSGTADAVLALANEGLTNIRRDDAPWTIVAGHHQLFTSSTRRSGEEREPGPPTLRLYELLRAANVDLYASGHQHHLELLTRGNAAPAFVTSGAASRPKQFFEFARSTGKPHFPFDPSFEQHGFAVLDLTRDAMQLTFYDDAGAPLTTPFILRRGPASTITVQHEPAR